MRPGDIGWMPRVAEVATDREQYREKEEPARRQRRKKPNKEGSDASGRPAIGETGRHIDLRA